MTKIFIVTHEKSPILANDILVPIQVGNRANIETNILRDNTLNNISNKNNNFCELTAAYWIWKNYKEAEIVGICHYRRYFNFFNPIYNLKPSAQKKISVSTFKQTKTSTSPATPKSPFRLPFQNPCHPSFRSTRLRLSKPSTARGLPGWIF